MRARALAILLSCLILSTVYFSLEPKREVSAQTNLGTTVLASVNSEEVQANGKSLTPFITDDGKFVAFSSDAPNLQSGAAPMCGYHACYQVYLRDMEEGLTTLISRHTNGTVGNGESYLPVVAPDGSYVAFLSAATNLTNSSNNNRTDLFIHELRTGITTAVSTYDDGASNRTNGLGLSADGRYLVFLSYNSQKLNVYDRQTQSTSTVAQLTDKSFASPDISDDGRYITFASEASTLVPGDTQTCNFYGIYNCADVFVIDRQTGVYSLVSRHTNGTQGNRDSEYPRISGNGRYVAFQSGASTLVDDDSRLCAYDSNHCTDVFVHDRITGETSLVSRHSNGTIGNRGSLLPSISSDGQYVAFHSEAGNLVDDDVRICTWDGSVYHNCYDTFVRDRATDTTTIISRHTNGTYGNRDSYGAYITSQGDFVVFSSEANNLVDLDTNSTIEDVFIHDREGSVLGGDIVSLGFDPTTDGFSFGNFGATYESDFPLEDTRYLFDSAERCVLGHCFFRPMVQLWYWWVSRGAKPFMVCFGMASTSLLLFEKLGPDDRNEPADFQANASLTRDLLNEDSGSQIRRYIALNQVRQKAPPVSWALSDSYHSTLSDSLEEVINGMEPDGTPVVLTLSNREFTGAHSFVPIEVEDKGNGLFIVTLYNPNLPSRTDSLTIDTNAKTWTLESRDDVVWEGDEESDTLSVIPITEFTRKSGIIFPPSDSLQTHSTEDQRIQVSSSSLGQLLITDSFGRQLGYIDHSFVSEIPDAYVVWPESALGEPSEPIYQLPYGFEYTVLLNGHGIAEPTSGGLLILLPELFFSLDNIAVTSGTHDEISLGIDNAIIYTSVDSKEIDVSLAAEPDSVHGQLFTFSGVDLSGIDEVRIIYDANSNAVKLEQGQAASSIHDVEYYFQDEVGEHSFSNASVTTLAGSSQIYDVDSSDESGAVICTDENRDGVSDVCRNIENEAPPLVNNGVTMLASAAVDGTPGNSDSLEEVISANGRFVAFTSYATNLVPGDTSQRLDVFVRDLETGQIERVSVSSNEQEANGESGSASISGDGRYVVFSSSATNLIPNDTNGQYDLFLRDRLLGTTTRVSVRANGSQIESYTYDGVISDNGRYVLFENQSQLTSNAPYGGWFLRDLQTQAISLVATSGEIASYLPSMSADGSLIAFKYYGWATDPEGNSLQGQLLVQDTRSGIRQPVSKSTDGSLGNSGGDAPHISADGQYVVFTSMSDNLIAGDTNAKSDVFIHDRLGGTTQLVSRTNGGLQANGYSHAHGVSANGRYVVFDSNADNLAAGDVNNYPDIFLYDVLTGRLSLVSATPEGVPASGRSARAHLSDDGRIIVFGSSANNLVDGAAGGIFVRMPAEPESNYYLEGRIVDSMGSPVAGVTVSEDSGRTATTGSDGSFQISGLPLGTYNVTPTKQGVTFSPPSLQVSLPPSSVHVDFTATSTPSPFPNTFYISPAANVTIAGIAAQGADILRYTKSTNTWTMVYDGSARGTLKNIAAFDMLDDGSLLLVFGVNQVIPGLGTATPYDVVKFTPNTPGVFPLGAGTYSWFFQGKTKGLTTAAEKIDAIDKVFNRLLISITGTGSVPVTGGTMKPADEDAFTYDPATGTWLTPLRLDGSVVPGLAVEDVNGIWDDPSNDDYYITILGAFNLGGVKGNDKSIVRLTPNGSGGWTPSLVTWLAPGATFPGKIDGLDIVR